MLRFSVPFLSQTNETSRKVNVPLCHLERLDKTICFQVVSHSRRERVHETNGIIIYFEPAYIYIQEQVETESDSISHIIATLPLFVTYVMDSYQTPLLFS